MFCAGEEGTRLQKYLGGGNFEKKKTLRKRFENRCSGI